MTTICLLFAFFSMANNEGKTANITYKDKQNNSHVKTAGVLVQWGCHLLLTPRHRSWHFPNKFKDKFCPICEDGIVDSQAHVMNCPAILSKSIVQTDLNYDNLFQDDVLKQIQVSSVIMENFKRRKEIIKKKETSPQ